MVGSLLGFLERGLTAAAIKAGLTRPRVLHRCVRLVWLRSPMGVSVDPVGVATIV